ncbi:GGDEF domain-containing protein [Croceicoccus estronivorus]|uniref:GGDEF domain-containing protein n=1 Tax=Croceicoccus estronivorus TaxID=1172626 RepID=UPI001F302087|nr:diguanylate cyclase [Croceicoccus estronivorus]
MNFTPQESSALYGLLAESTTDIILKTDLEGYILHASPGMAKLGFPMPDMLIGPHVLDLIHPNSVEAVKAEHDAAVHGTGTPKWIEVSVMTADRRKRWFEMQIRCLTDSQDHIYGALTIMRSIDERRKLEDRLFVAELTDPLTGLTNRKAFIAMLQHLVDEEIGGCLALFDVDYFQAINMQYGQTVGDKVLVVFSDLLRTMTREEDIISRIGGECLGVLLPGVTPEDAEAICQRIVSTLSELRKDAGGGNFPITASAGVSRINDSLDDTMRRAELALFLAKAKGRNRLEMESGPRFE